VRSETDPRGIDYHWLQLERHSEPDEAGTETAELAAGCITVTPLQFERTHQQALAAGLAAADPARVR
jgi:5'-nucleotidase